MLPDLALRRFVRALQAGTGGVRQGRDYVVPQGNACAPAAAILQLIRSGALGGDEQACYANTETRAWLRRAHLDAGASAAQHRLFAISVSGIQASRSESPLTLL